MTRSLTLAAAQLGPIARDEPRSSAVERMRAVGRLLSHRGYRDVSVAERLLSPRAADLLDPLLMADMETAAARLLQIDYTTLHRKLKRYDLIL